MGQNYLHECLAAFPEITKKMYGTASDMGAVEDAVASLHTQKSLTFEDLRRFETEGNWAFKTWWVFPPEAYVRSVLAYRAFDLAALPKGPSMTDNPLRQEDVAQLVALINRPT